MIEDIEQNVISPTTPKLKGRPKGAKNKIRDKDHLSTREPARFSERDVEHDKPRVRTRRSNANYSSPLDFPLEEIPEGSSYEWKRYSNVGEEDHHYIAQLRLDGWEPVDPRRHPNRVPPGYDKPNIIYNGLILMERPLELTLAARREASQNAKQKMVEAEQRLGLAPKELGSDTMTRQHPGLKTHNRVVKEFVRAVPVVED